MPCFSFYLLCFSSYKIGEQEEEKVMEGRGCTSERREVVRKGVRG
jgi:hypothetical protein